MKPKIIKGDATNPHGTGFKIIAHVVNDSGKWGKGFVMALSKKWPYLRNEYLNWYNECQEPEESTPFELGQVMFLGVNTYTSVANMLAQHGLVGRSNKVPLRYDALQESLKKVADYADYLTGKNKECSVHMPRIGCGLAGGKWDKVEPIIIEELCTKGIPVTVYDL